MKFSDVLREFFYPLTDTTVLVTLAVFTVLVALSQAAGIFGVWLLLVVSFTFLKYTILLLEARALNARTPVPDVDLFTFTHSNWALAPWTIWISAQAAASILISLGYLPAALAVLLLLAVLFPAICAETAVSHEVLAGFNLVRVFEIIRVLGLDYLYVLLITLLGTAAMVFARELSLPPIVDNFLFLYVTALAFTMTGAAMHAHRNLLGLATQHSPEQTEEKKIKAIENRWRGELDRAYAFASRGNREGALKCLKDLVDGEANGDELLDWVFEQLGEWETTQVQCNFGSYCIKTLLAAGATSRALDFAGRCLAIDADFLPYEDDRVPLIDAAAKHANLALKVQLRANTEAATKSAAS